MSFVEFHDVKKTYHMGEVEIPALQGVNFEIEKGEFCVIVGASGAGKTTILNILGGMDTLTEGKVLLGGKEISSYGKKQLTDYRRYDIGFVFQFYNLVGNLTALENVELASQICSDPLDAGQVLADVGLADRASNFPAQLSGGEQQKGQKPGDQGAQNHCGDGGDSLPKGHGHRTASLFKGFFRRDSTVKIKAIDGRIN